MKWRNWPLIPCLLFLCLSQGNSFAQVIEERKGESNPGALLFKTTLYGVGTGLILGGAYALVEDNPDVSTSEALRWSAAGGAVGGLLVGLVYLIAGPTPKGDAEEVDTHHEGGAAPDARHPVRSKKGRAGQGSIRGEHGCFQGCLLTGGSARVRGNERRIVPGILATLRFGAAARAERPVWTRSLGRLGPGKFLRSISDDYRGRNASPRARPLECLEAFSSMAHHPSGMPWQRGHNPRPAREVTTESSAGPPTAGPGSDGNPGTTPDRRARGRGSLDTPPG